MTREDFLQGSATVRIYETRLLDKMQMERMIDSKDFHEALKMLSETTYSKAISTLDNPEEYGDALQKELNSTYEKVNKLNKGEIIYDFVTLRYSFHNLKVLIKEHILNTDFSHILSKLGNVDITQIRNDLKNENFLSEAKYMNYVSKVIEDYKNNQDPQRIDILLDKFYLNELLDMANKLKFDLFINYAKDSIDVSNIKSLLRSKNQNKSYDFIKDVLLDNGVISKEQLLDIYENSLEEILERLMSTHLSKYIKKGLDNYRKSARLQDVEKELENFLMARVKESKTITYGPEILFAYLQSKESEIKNLRIILVSKLNGLSNEDIRERLRDGYV